MSESEFFEKLIHEKKNKYKDKKSISDKLMLLALAYVEECFYIVDDFLVPYPTGVNPHQFEKWVQRCFDALVRLTEKDVSTFQYRRAFSRLVSWVLTLDGDVMSHRNPCITLSRYMKGQFESQSNAANQKLNSIFCRVVLDLSTLEDAVQVAESYPDLVSSADLIKKIDEAIAARNRTAADKLIKILTTYESGHPDLHRFKVDLERLDKIIRIQTSGNLDIDSINEMSGAEFEQLIATQFEQLGFRVEITPATGDYGADLIVTTKSDGRISIQCKRFKSSVNLKAVQEVVASLSHYQCDYGVVITNSTFLNSAKKLAQNNDIELWDQDRLISFLSGDVAFSELENL